MVLSHLRALSRLTSALTALPRSHWVVAELDGRGRIDRHARMCLELGIEGALAAGAQALVVDLRDLTAIDTPELEIFVRARAACQAEGTPVGLLISGHESHAPLADAFAAVGLGDLLAVTSEPGAPASRGARVIPLHGARRAQGTPPEVAHREWTRDSCI